MKNTHKASTLKKINFKDILWKPYLHAFNPPCSSLKTRSFQSCWTQIWRPPVPAPKESIILFDGTSFKGWEVQKNKRAKTENPQWKLLKDEKAMEVVTPSGYITLQEKLLSHGHLHIEWATPAVVKGKGQGRGNSGVFIEGFPEVQVLDSYRNKTYPMASRGSIQKEQSLSQCLLLRANGNAMIFTSLAVRLLTAKKQGA